MITEIVKTTIRGLLSNNHQNEFPIEFDWAWQTIGFSRKDHGKRCLLKNFQENIDFILLPQKEESNQLSLLQNFADYNPKREDIYLTLDCFKSLCMLAQTSIGKEVRMYFLECEKELFSLKDKRSEIDVVLERNPIIAQMIKQETMLYNIENKVKDESIKLQNTIHELNIAKETLSSTQQQINDIRSKLPNQEDAYYEVKGYANLKGIKLDNTTASKIGKAASKVSKEKNTPIYKAKHSKYGEVNTYHKDILDIALKAHSLI